MFLLILRVKTYKLYSWLFIPLIFLTIIIQNQ